VSAAVRQAGLEDLDALVPLFDAYRRFYGQPGDLALARSFLRERFASLQSAILIAEQDGAAVGFVQLYPSFSSTRAQRIYVLNDLYVAPEARKHGVGRALMEAAAEFGRRAGAARLALSTQRTNAAAQALYESCGWVKDEEFLHYGLKLS
jgi:ribosomal protein S18 acetylase RimI-like enzyme